MENESSSFLFKQARWFLDMDPQHSCNEYDTISLFCTVVEISLLVIFSHIVHMFLKRLGQPSAVSQMLVGIIMGPSVMGHFNLLNKDRSRLIKVSEAVPNVFMFLLGLESDFLYLLRAFRLGMPVVSGSAISCGIVCFVVCPVLFKFIYGNSNVVVFSLVHWVILFNTASPVLIRVLRELKLTMTPIGRMAFSAALITEIVCLIFVALLDLFGSNSTMFMFLSGIVVLFVLIVVSYILNLVVKKINDNNAFRVQVGDDVVCFLLLVLFGVCYTINRLEFDPMLAAFVLGIVMPKEGPTTRTMIGRLTYIMNNILLPLYFGLTGLQTDLSMLRKKEVWITSSTVILLGIVGKVGGTMAAAKYVKMQIQEGLALGLLLNIKGHADLMVIVLGKRYGIWNEHIYMALIITVLFNSITACPIAAYVVRQERRASKHRSKIIESLKLESELRILACVHSLLELPAILSLIEISNIPSDYPRLAPYILHLTQLNLNATRNVLYHQLEDKDSNTTTMSGQAEQISASIDTFNRGNNIYVRRFSAISNFSDMHEDVENGVQDVHASLVILPFHRKKRVDGQMGVESKEMKQFNINVLNSVSCSVGILVDRGTTGKEDRESTHNNKHNTLPTHNNSMLNVVVLFLGGKDDREAVAYATRLSLHPFVYLTLIRFLPSFRQSIDRSYGSANNESSQSKSLFLDIDDSDLNEAFMENIYKKFVVTGMITYKEMCVSSSSELITTLSSLNGAFSLYIVGKQVQGPATQLTSGMNNWVECPELGAIGDLLASSDFMLTGSVLIIQQKDTPKH